VTQKWYILLCICFYQQKNLNGFGLGFLLIGSPLFDLKYYQNGKTKKLVCSLWRGTQKASKGERTVLLWDIFVTEKPASRTNNCRLQPFWC
jgi:hypothetical protein